MLPIKSIVQDSLVPITLAEPLSQNSSPSTTASSSLSVEKIPETTEMTNEKESKAEVEYVTNETQDQDNKLQKNEKE